MEWNSSSHSYYQERFVWPLTSSTSIYSGVSLLSVNDAVGETNTTVELEEEDNDDDSKVVLQWATQYHTCSLPLPSSMSMGGDAQHPSSVSTSQRNSTQQPILHSKRLTFHTKYQKQPPPPQHCVGYVATTRWEVMAFMDTSKINVSYDHPINTTTSSSPGTTSNNNNNASFHATDEDHHSVSTGILLPTSHHRRNSSLSSIPETIVDTANTTNDTNTMATSNGSSLMDSISNIIQNSHTTTNTAISSSVYGQPQPHNLQHHSSYSLGGESALTTGTATQYPMGTTDTENHTQKSNTILPTMTILDTQQIGQLRIRRTSSNNHNNNSTTRTISSSSSSSSPPPPRNHSNDTIHSRTATTAKPLEEYQIYLDYRPLALTISEMKHNIQKNNKDDKNDDDDDDDIVLIWLGSADQNQLHCYTVLRKQNESSTTSIAAAAVASQDDTAIQSLLPIRSIDALAAFIVLSPVMALQYIQWMESDTTSIMSPKHCLVLACQDGTVRIVVFDIQIDTSASTSADKITFQNVQMNQVIIDGPIVAIHAQQQLVTNHQYQHQHSMIHVTIGSLCGYVAELHLNATTMEFHPHSGPSMVVQGFWNGRLHVEDSVMCLYRYHNYVCVGTQAGRCYIYRNLYHSDPSGTFNGANSTGTAKYHMEWSCQLPYPIHSMTMISDEYLFIITRRTVHLFQQRFHSTGSNQETIVASANRIKDRILQLQRQKDANKMERELQQRIEEVSLVDMVVKVQDPVMGSTSIIEHLNSETDDVITTEQQQPPVPHIKERIEFMETIDHVVVSELVDLV